MFYAHEVEERKKRFNPDIRLYNKHMPAPSLELVPMMKKYLEERELSEDLARYNMWYPSREAGDSHPRIVIPASASVPSNIFWQARTMDDDPKRYQSPRASRGDAVIVVWPHKTHLLWRAAVVEGPMCALAASAYGFLGVALMGQTPPDTALSLVYKLTAGLSISLICDLDSTEAMVKIMGKMLSYTPRITAMSIIQTYPYKDLAEAPESFRRRILSA